MAWNNGDYTPMPYTSSAVRPGVRYADAQAMVSPTTAAGHVTVFIKNTASRDGYGRDIYWVMYDAHHFQIGAAGGFPNGPIGDAYDGAGIADSGPHDTDSTLTSTTEVAVGNRYGARQVRFYAQGSDDHLATIDIYPYGTTPNDPPPEPVARPPVGPEEHRRWTLQTLDGSQKYIFPINPNAMTSPVPARDITWQQSREGFTGTRAGRSHHSWEFSGVLRTEQEMFMLLYWLDKREWILLTDDLGQSQIVRLVSFKPTQNAGARSRHAPWRHTYTMTCLSRNDAP